MQAPTIASTPIRRSSRWADDASAGLDATRTTSARDRLQPAEPRRERAPAVDVEAAGDMGGGVGRAGPHVEDHGRAGGAVPSVVASAMTSSSGTSGRGARLAAVGNHALRGAIAAK